MSILKKNPKNVDKENKNKFPQSEASPKADENEWDDLFKIGIGEQIRYEIAEILTQIPRGSAFSLEKVFQMPPSFDEYAEFLKYLNWHLVAKSFDSEEELKEAIEKDEDNPAIQKKIAYTLLYAGKYSEATTWFEKAVKHDDVEAITRVAGAYDHSMGIPNKSVDVIGMLKKAIIIDGFPDALLDLGLKYINGNGVPQDEKIAFHFMKRAALQGLAAAQYNLGIMYMNGNGIAQNIQLALYWMELSAHQGYEMAFPLLISFYDQNHDEINKSRIIDLGVQFDIEECKTIKNKQ